MHPQVDGEFGWQRGARLCAKHQPQQVWRDSEPEMLLRLAFSTVALVCLAGTRSMQGESPCRGLTEPTEAEARRTPRGRRLKGRRQTLDCRNTNVQ